MKLYSYFRSSAAYRARIALNLKGLPYEYLPVHLVRDGGEQHAPAYRSVAPEGLVPVLVDGDTTVHQSLAIIEYLDETHPQPPLLPAGAAARAAVRAIALDIACDIHPLCNTRVLKYLGANCGLQKEGSEDWIRHWIGTGFAALETRLAHDPARGAFCHGDAPTMADICMVGHVTAAINTSCDLVPYREVMRVFDTAMALPAFAKAHPLVQQDTPEAMRRR